MEYNLDVMATIGIALAGGIATLHTRASAAEKKLLIEANEALQENIQQLDRRHREDMKRMDGMFLEVWTEIKCQRESLTQNREATIKLLSSIERLNEILDKIELRLVETVTKTECKLMHCDYAEHKRRHDYKEAIA